MALRASLRPTDPEQSLARRISTVEVQIEKQKNETRARKTYDASLAKGYAALMKDQTLAGRKASRHFTKSELQVGVENRKQSIARLRRMESWMLWRDMVADVQRALAGVVHRWTPIKLIDYR